MWVIYALLSAIFAALTSILAKIGMTNLNSNLATAIRTIVVLIMAWVVVFVTGAHKDVAQLTRTNYIYLILSGLATGASWLFYFYAISLGEVSRVAPIDKLSVVFTIILAYIILNETITFRSIIAMILITSGSLLLIK